MLNEFVKKGNLFFVLLILFVSNVSAVELFYDNFESGNLNGWTLNSLSNVTNWTANQTNSYQGNWHAQSRPLNSLISANVMERTISTAGYSNINFSYYRKIVEFDNSSDEFRVKWFNGVKWITLEDTPEIVINDSNYVLKNFVLPKSANNKVNFKIKFECSANAQNEFCRVDNVKISGQVKPVIQVTPSYVGALEYMTDNWYSVLVNQSSQTVTFRGLNQSNNQGLIVVPIDSQNHFSKRINYVWFDGWFDNSSLYLNQYVGTGNSYFGNSSQMSSGAYVTQVTLPNSLYAGINSSILVTLLTNFNTMQSQFAPSSSLGAQTTANIDPIWNAAGHPYGEVLYQSQVLTNGSLSSAEISEWVKEDLSVNGMTPRWTVSLTKSI